ncbi:MAG: FAD-dependent oxidoreductase [Planctomycetota bacterium]|nr:FAD-dependent oxidoreductase [Planctomycetota bacterium]
MDHSLSRRDWLRALGVSGATAGLGALGVGRAAERAPGESSGFSSHVIDAHAIQTKRASPTMVDGKVIQPQRELSVLHKTDVLVVGGGPAGVVAAIAARRAGAEVTLVERYGHFGGLWTGGLVLLVTGHIIKGGKQVCQGIGEELMRRLDKLDGAIINRRPGVDPTVDAEAVKYVMVEMVEEAGVKVFLHCWGVDAIVNGNAVAGAVFESKSGRQAILAKTVVDASGDGDLFAAAGAEFEHRSHNIGLVTRLGNLDRVDREKAKQGSAPKHLGGITPVPGVNWVNMLGPEVDGLDVATLTRMEMNHRKFIWKTIQKTRQTPGYETVYLMETAPQLGVRITRVLAGLKAVTHVDLKNGTKLPDVVGVGGASGGGHGEWQIPYGALVPVKLDNLLAAGRCINAELRMADLVRLIPNCFVTGHAAGVAAAVAVQDNCLPREVEVAKVQKILRQQEAYLG